MTDEPEIFCDYSRDSQFPQSVIDLKGNPLILLAMAIYRTYPDMTLVDAMAMMIVRLHQHSLQGDELLRQSLKTEAGRTTVRNSVSSHHV